MALTSIMDRKTAEATLVKANVEGGFLLRKKSGETLVVSVLTGQACIHYLLKPGTPANGYRWLDKVSA